MIMQRLRHLIESADVQIQSWDRKHVRAITKIARQLQVSCIVADGRGEPQCVVGRIARPLVPHQPLEWAESGDQFNRFDVLLLHWREVLFSLPSDHRLQAARKSTRLNSSHYCASRMPSSA